jgi:hypothetical protein
MLRSWGFSNSESSDLALSTIGMALSNAFFYP